MSKIKTTLINLWYRITRVGITEHENYAEARRIILVNEIAFFGFITPQFYNLFYYLYNYELLKLPIFINVIGSLICASIYYLNHKQHHLAAKYVITISPNIQIFALTYFLSTATGMHLLHIMMISFVMFLFSDQPKSRIALNSSFPVILYLVSFFLFTPDSSPIILHADILVILYIIISITVFSLVILFFSLFYREIDLSEKLLENEYKRSEKLLLNILPNEVAQRLKDDPGTIAEEYPSVTILFADIVGFTTIASSIAPDKLIKTLNSIFSEFDKLMEKYDLEKIKTIGDAYMVAGGIPVETEDHTERVARLALDMKDAISSFSVDGQPLQVRIGFHTGSVIAGVIGEKKFSYDIWGDAVNLASRLESHGDVGKIHVSKAVYSLLKNDFEFEPRGDIEIKGIGPMETYFLKDIA